MKSTLAEANKETYKETYPFLGKHDYSDLVILFTADSIGTVVREGDNKKLGQFGDDWYMSVFIRLAPGSTITIEQ